MHWAVSSNNSPPCAWNRYATPSHTVHRSWIFRVLPDWRGCAHPGCRLHASRIWAHPLPTRSLRASVKIAHFAARIRFKITLARIRNGCTFWMKDTRLSLSVFLSRSLSLSLSVTQKNSPILEHFMKALEHLSKTPSFCVLQRVVGCWGLQCVEVCCRVLQSVADSTPEHWNI